MLAKWEREIVDHVTDNIMLTRDRPMPKRKKEITWGGARPGAGRPPLPPEQRRPRPPRARITFDLEPEQAELVDAKANAQGVSRSAYIRALVLADIGVTDIPPD